MKKGLLFSVILVLNIIISDKIYSQSIKYFESFDETKIAYSDEGTGEAVLLIHGFISNASSWKNTDLKKKLLEKGYRVIIPDLRGNGFSDKPQNAEDYAKNAEIKDLKGLMTSLNLKNYYAVGYSRGSIVLAKLLSIDKRIKKAILGGMGIDFTNPEWDRKLRFGAAFRNETPPDDLTSGAINYAKSIKADLMVLGYLQLHQPVTSLKELSKIKSKVLILCGDQDIDNGDPKYLQNAIPKSKLILVPGTHNETHKSISFAEAAIDFFLN